MTPGPDGNIWFTDFVGQRIGRITPAGAFTEFPVPGSPGGITAGPDGNIWFTEPLAIGRLIITPTVDLRVDVDTFVPGDRLRVDVGVANPGPELTADVYFGALLPSEAGPALGCPAGDPIVLVAEEFTQALVTCLSASPESLPPLFRSSAIPERLPPTILNDFFSFTWPQGVPRGRYTLFLVLTRAGALSDGALNAGDLLAVGSASVTLTP
jgi:hypothetical protein